MITLTGHWIKYTQEVTENGETIKIFDFMNKAIFYMIEGNICEGIGKPLRVTLRRYKVIPWDDQKIPEQLTNSTTTKLIFNKLREEPISFTGKDKKEVKNCSNCIHHNYDWYTEGPNAYDEFEVCEKGHELHPNKECKDWEEL